MSHARPPLVLLGLLYAGFAGFLAWSATELPARVASHFNFAGQPDGWMSRTSYLLVEAALAIGLPLFIVGISSLTRVLPARLWNLPHREYWLAPERRKQTSAWLVQH